MSPAPATPSPNSGTHIPVATLTKLGEIEHGFVITDELLDKILDQFIKDFAVGLSKYGEGMAMVPTYVTGVPTGKETGYVRYMHCAIFNMLIYFTRTFLALDLGGTNLCATRSANNYMPE